MTKRTLYLLTGLLSGAGIGLIIYYNLIGQFPGIVTTIVISAGTGLYGLLLLGGFYIASQWLNKVLAWEKQFSARIIIDFLSNALLAIFSSGVIYYTILRLVMANSPNLIWETNKESFLTLWILMVVFVLMHNIISLVFYASSHYAEGQITDVRNDRKQLKLQYDSLKNQLSPHFLFNGLNTISSLIHQDAERAEDFIRRLADIYSYVLDTHRQRLVPLKKELDFVKAYFILLSVRFQEGLDLEVKIPNHLYEYSIPPLTIQILIENAIKHNVFSESEPLYITLSATDDGEIRVVNNKTKPPQAVKSNYVGLNNIKRRYSYFTNQKIKITDEQNFEVSVPVLKNNPISSAA